MRLNPVMFILTFSLLMLSSCSQEVSTPASVATANTSTPPATATVPPTSENIPTLDAGQWTHLFYHEGLDQVVLVNGGPERGKPADDPLELWGWDGSQWSLVGADENGPSWRNWAAVAYDPARDVLVVHGGLQDGTDFDETWEWNGQTWTQIPGTGPGAREGALMAYDAARAQMILFGGSTPDMEIHGDTWALEGRSWMQVSEAGPAERFPGGMIYDPAQQQVLLYSGHFAASTGEFVQYDDLWAWEGTSWREIRVDGQTPAHRTHPGFVYDPVTETVLLVGSGSDTFSGDVWSWDGTSWQEIPTSNTPARTGYSVAYDPNRDRFVLFGGVDRPGGKALNDTWEWDRLEWSCVNNCQ